MRTLLALLLVVSPGPSLDPDQPQATGRAVLETGHVDIGPRVRDGQWTIQIHDDHATPPVWRDPADTVLRVLDTAELVVPDDEDYAFLGAPAGAKVHVVPQTERPGVVWVGWNTQDPGVLATAGRGVTMTLRGVQGPGPVTVFLQSGNLGAPQVLWSSARPFPQPLWVETNTHTHANWVFGAPGVYLLAVGVTAELPDGVTAATDTVLRLAVGDATDPAAAFGAAYSVPSPSASGSKPSSGTSYAFPLGATGVLAATLTIGFVLLGQRRVRRRAEESR
ncbi:choice-of-anchor M domain-containing protein [Actinoplanes sp. NPDC026670]|uniref:choice-of-anchor M domain-containing protein n=1 Tax=Actinoplanes sp. NPDC026670 TaxID=3154700 RepID=UPI0033E386E0